ncbi:hypothetical protein CQW23_09686 [Capsicum baccatum]|uniref:Ubiquitin-like protease family profile domain-containing protein n=1 Tax=Capsicum baccatum TaxID=33114 RepID=A0A2G2WXP2_CAPBA|nr:hypothetical protein CQW23_09686 [Capsicum baccatum]
MTTLPSKMQHLAHEDALKIDQKFKDLERLMKARFTEVLNSLEQKNETVKQETIVKQSRQECDPSDAVVDNARPTSIDNVVKEIDKQVEMEDDKANQTTSFLKKGEQHEKDVGIEKQSDIAVEEIQPLESIIPGREHDLALTIYKPPPTTPAEYEISDTIILSAFSTPQKNVLANKSAPAPCSRKPSKIYHSPFLTHFGSSSKGKKKLASNERKKIPFEGYHITGDSPTVEMKIFEEWIHDGLYKQHTEKTDEVADMEKSLINTIKGLSTCADQPWHIVNEYNKFFEHKVPTDWTALKSYGEKSERNSFQVEYVSEIAQQSSGSLDCGVFVAVYTEYLSEGLGIPCSDIDAQYHCLRYSSFLCKYGSEKAENGYFSENDDPPRSRSKFAHKKKRQCFTY